MGLGAGRESCSGVTCSPAITPRAAFAVESHLPPWRTREPLAFSLPRQDTSPVLDGHGRLRTAPSTPNPRTLSWEQAPHKPPASIPLPKLLPKVLRQPVIRPIIRRPPHEAQVEHVDVLAAGRPAIRLELAEVPEGGGGPALLGEGAVEDDGALVGELGEEGGEGVLEGCGGDVEGCLDVASDVVWGVLVCEINGGGGGLVGGTGGSEGGTGRVGLGWVGEETHTVVAHVDDGVAPLLGIRLREDNIGEFLCAHALQRVNVGHLIVRGVA